VALLAGLNVSEVGVLRGPATLLTLLTYKLLLPEHLTQLFAPVSKVGRYVYVSQLDANDPRACDNDALDLNSGKTSSGGLTNLAVGSELSNDMWLCAFDSFRAISRDSICGKRGLSTAATPIGTIQGFNYTSITG
jgi:hypothetical protein